MALRVLLYVYRLYTLSGSIFLRRARGMTFGASLSCQVIRDIYLLRTIITLGIRCPVLGTSDRSVAGGGGSRGASEFRVASTQMDIPFVRFVEELSYQC